MQTPVAFLYLEKMSEKVLDNVFTIASPFVTKILIQSCMEWYKRTFLNHLALIEWHIFLNQNNCGSSGPEILQ